MNKLIKIPLSIIILLQASLLNAQNENVEMATGFYQEGKIYIVIGVISIIFLGIIAYLILIDRKVSKLEKEIKNK